MAELATLARPYAKAAFEAAAEANDLQTWSAALALAAAVAQQEKMQELISSPAYTTAQKGQAFIDVCGDQLGEKAQNLIRTLADAKRIPLLPFIQQQFEALKALKEKAIDVEVSTAFELSAEMQNKLAKALSAKLDREVTLQSSIDKSLLGGAIIRAGDTVIDGSVRGRLAKLAEAMNS